MAGLNISLLILLWVFCLIAPSRSNDNQTDVSGENQTIVADNKGDQHNVSEPVEGTRIKDNRKKIKNRNKNEKRLEKKYKRMNKRKGPMKYKKRSTRIVGDTKYLTSPNYPNKYPNNQNIRQVLSVPQGRHIKVTFSEFQIERHSTCGYDYIQFCDGNGKCLDKMCGTNIPQDFTIETSTATVLFNTDGSVTLKGYKLSYQPGGCTGTTSHQSCCSSSFPCQKNEGDCDNDSDCAGSLVCGSNNCKEFHPFAEATADCCIKPNLVGMYGIGDSYVIKRFYCFWLAKCSNAHYYEHCCDVFRPYCPKLKCREKQKRKSCDMRDTGWASVGTGCYRVINADTFEQGKEFCEKNMGSLVEITSQVEQDVLTKFYKDSHLSGEVWIGAQKTKENKWKWIDSDKEITFNLWGKGDLVYNAIGTENCLVWDGGNSWKDINCDHRNESLKAFCEKRHECNSTIIQNTASSEFAEPCTCGRSTVTGTSNKNLRMVGGQTTEKNEFPWQVALKYGDAERPFCGGTLISRETVLTAAHCTEGLCAEDITVLTGEHNVMDNSDGQREIEVRQIIQHTAYNFATIDYDFSLLILNNSTKCDEKVKPIRLPKQSINYENVKAIVSGWGEQHDSFPSNTLKKANVMTMTNTKCTTGTQYNTSDITPHMICASGSEGDACRGDSGGPLVTLEADSYFSLIGVVSWGGLECGKANTPGVYARVAEESSWIQDNMIGHTCVKGSVYLIAGGSGARRDITLYHPSKANIACSTPPPALNKDWAHHSTFYHDNTIYLCGGFYTSSTCISQSPGNPWKTHTLTIWKRWTGHSTVVIQDWVYFVGGPWGSSGNYYSAQSMDLPLTATPVFTPVPNLNYKGWYQCTAKLDLDTLVITGGYKDGILSTVSTYNSQTRAYTQLPQLKQARTDHGCGVWEEGNNKWIIVAGGFNDNTMVIQTTEMMQLGESQWISLGDLKVPRRGHAMAVTQRGVMAIGGKDANNLLSSVELLDWNTKTWSLVQPSINNPRYDFGGAVKIPDSMFGCKANSNQSINDGTIDSADG